MQQFPSSLQKKLNDRRKENALRTLHVSNSTEVDFYSNDYLGFAKSLDIAKMTDEILKENGIQNGSTGSRLISGTHHLHLWVEKELAMYHRAESGLLYNSGYDANVGLFSAILQKNDVLLFDELIHASVRDGIRLSTANNYKFKHNNLSDLEAKMIRFKETSSNVYVAVETVYSMDGDIAPLQELVILCEKHKAYLIIDEAHSGGVFGEKGRGLACELGLESKIFARVHTFGKALGCHGAIVLGGQDLRNYLINFSRAFIYTTAIPLHAVATIKAAFAEISQGNAMDLLKDNIDYFKNQLSVYQLKDYFIESISAIQCCLISGNNQVKKVALEIQEQGFLVKPIMSPTVPKGQERLRICLHAHNTKEEINNLLLLLSSLIKIEEI
ncbi:pyridoxal phosphate-dependent aminotransferase family protein [Wenyingzhuangia sp. chi5]|uniref:Pyridoxal phosphate-dependent aminotransferase family protein n=1 Tax=Wenyingzhuangia gilva TaxID=3057677 RepID=A0ABT8VP45_9FLAO|nr:pyridoxal phosphate-dependent aminotransferase family protein [Wenyingzhuangia sp. chi5]MDO3693726.1 pyridoxal phosphate-dependent aminotransferase family protein [Wenyingzhuangia sp. chi5]